MVQSLINDPVIVTGIGIIDGGHGLFKRALDVVLGLVLAHLKA